MSEQDAATPIGPDMRVTLHFALLLPSGEQVDSTFDRQPATFEVGDGSLPPGFEDALFGLVAGEDASLTIEPAGAFGMPNPDNVQRMPRSAFAADLELEPGLVVSFADAAKAELPGVVRELDGDEVVVDFNHPLAGKTLRFDVSVLAVEPAA